MAILFSQILFITTTIQTVAANILGTVGTSSGNFFTRDGGGVRSIVDEGIPSSDASGATNGSFELDGSLINTTLVHWKGSD